MSKKKCVIYARVSPSPRDDDGNEMSIKDQIDLCTEYANQQGSHREGWKIVGKFYDQGVSGADDSRPGLWGAIKELGSDTYLVVYKLDRLARGVFLSHLIEKQVQKVGSSIRSVRGEGTWSDTPEDRVMRNMLRAFDEYFREINAKRISDSMRARQRRGHAMGDIKRPAYGWRVKNAEKRLLEVDPQEMENVNYVRELLGKKYSSHRVAKRLNREEIPPRSGKWTSEKILRLIRVHDLPYPYNPEIEKKWRKRTGY